MKVNKRQEIFGLNHVPAETGSDVFDVLFGETLVRQLDRTISCEHNFCPQYLKRTSSSVAKTFHRYFKNLPGKLVVTNFRLLFVPTLDMNLQ